MERTRQGSGGSALVKAAAWAWYEHGTGLEGKSMQEFDIRRSFHDPRPSRFKLEAKKLAEQGSSGDFDDRSLLDRYEIESISRRLDQLIASSGDKGKVYAKGFLVGDQHHPGYISSKSSLPPKLQAGDCTNRWRKKTSSNLRGFWHRHAVICGSGSHKDVILGTTSFVNSLEQPKKRRVYSPVPVVKLANCRQRPLAL